MNLIKHLESEKQPTISAQTIGNSDSIMEFNENQEKTQNPYE